MFLAGRLPTRFHHGQSLRHAATAWRLVTRACLVLWTGGFAVAGHAENIAVIVNPANPTERLTADQVARIYLGKVANFPDNASATPLMHPEGDALRASFEASVLQKDPTQLRAYWVKQIFTGRGRPPEEIASDKEMKVRVATDPAALGYIRAQALDASVKTVFQIETED